MTNRFLVVSDTDFALLGLKLSITIRGLVDQHGRKVFKTADAVSVEDAFEATLDLLSKLVGEPVRRESETLHE